MAVSCNMLTEPVSAVLLNASQRALTVAGGVQGVWLLFLKQELADLPRNVKSGGEDLI